MLITNTPAKPHSYSVATEVGKSVSMPQALAYLAQRRPMARPLPKVIVRRKRP